VARERDGQPTAETGLVCWHAACATAARTHNGGVPMTTIPWLSDLGSACKEARERGKLVLLDFFSPV